MLSRGGHHVQIAEEMEHKDWGQIRKSYGRYIPTLLQANELSTMFTTFRMLMLIAIGSGKAMDDEVPWCSNTLPC